MYSLTKGLNLTELRAAAEEINPSITIGFLFFAADREYSTHTSYIKPTNFRNYIYWSFYWVYLTSILGL